MNTIRIIRRAVSRWYHADENRKGAIDGAMAFALAMLGAAVLLAAGIAWHIAVEPRPRVNVADAVRW